MIPGFEESPMWRVFASDEDKKAFYEKRITEYQEMQVHIICIEWDKNWDRSGERELISEALIRKNENPMICRNPSQDSISRAKRETQNAEADAARERLKAQRARNAQRKAEQESEW